MPKRQSELALVGGVPFHEVPSDLYIPPDALEVILEAFEGPLDLLLYLIRRQNLDILEIKVAEITEQYMQYIALMEELQFELASEYLVMAAMLAEIKSRMLLPRPDATDEDEDDRDDYAHDDAEREEIMPMARYRGCELLRRIIVLGNDEHFGDGQRGAVLI